LSESGPYAFRQDLALEPSEDVEQPSHRTSGRSGQIQCVDKLHEVNASPDGPGKITIFNSRSNQIVVHRTEWALIADFDLCPWLVNALYAGVATFNDWHSACSTTVQGGE
jgi:hypothetical protein